MRKQRLSWLLALLILFGISLPMLPVAAASAQITTMQVVLQLPGIGAAPQAGLAVDPVHQTVFKLNEDGKWTDPDGKEMTEADKFEVGKSYTYQVSATALNGYAFGGSTVPVVPVAATNPSPLVTGLGVTISADSAVLSYTYTPLAAIDEVIFSRFTAPVLGENPSVAYSLASEKTYTSLNANLGSVNVKEGEWLAGGSHMNLSDKFTAGKHYQFRAKLSANEGYYFPAKLQAVLPDGSEVAAAYSDPYLTLDFGIFYDEIGTVRVGDVQQPEIGGTPAAAYTIPANPGYDYADKVAGQGTWFVMEDEEAVALEDDATFEEGKVYRFSLTLQAKKVGGNFADGLTVELYPASLKSAVQATEVTRTVEEKKVQIDLTFQPLTKEYVRPAGPKNFMARSVSTGDIRLSWSPVENTDYYAIFRLVGDKSLFQAVTKNTVWLDKRATSDEWNFYRVFSVREDANRKQYFSLAPTPNYAYAMSVVTPRPDAVDNFRAQSGSNGTIVLSWDPSARADYYVVYDLGDGSTSTFRSITTKTTWTDLHPTKGELHFYRVFAVRKNDSGEQVFSTGPNPNYVFAMAK